MKTPQLTNVEFVQAVNELAERFGLTVENFKDGDKDIHLTGFTYIDGMKVTLTLISISNETHRLPQ